MKEQLKILKKHILTGTSHMIPFIVAGGILFSLAVMLNPAGAATPETGWLAGLAQIGLGGLTLFPWCFDFWYRLHYLCVG